MQLSQIPGQLESCVFHTLGEKKKECVVIKRCFYRVTVTNVKHRGKLFVFPTSVHQVFLFPPNFPYSLIRFSMRNIM